MYNIKLYIILSIIIYNTNGASITNCIDSSTFWPCFKESSLKIIQRLSSMKSINILPGVTIVKDEAVTPQFTNDARLSNDIDDKLWTSVASLLQTHSIQIKLPVEHEGRGKLKKLGGPIILAAMMKGLLGSLAFGALAFLAGKALIISKMALMLSLILTLKKLLSGGDSHHETYEIISKHHEGSSSNHVTSVAEPSPGYFGHRKRSIIDPYRGHHIPANHKIS